MDRDKARVSLTKIADALVRQSETSRIEIAACADTLVNQAFIQLKGRVPQKEELARVASAVQTLIYDSPYKTPEAAVRVKYAQSVLDSELR